MLQSIITRMTMFDTSHPLTQLHREGLLTTHKPTQIMRYQDIRNKYTNHLTGAFKPEDPIFSIGEQMAYEWENDFIAMKWAIDYLINGGVSGKQMALDVLIKRISESSCPSNKKEEYKTKGNCPLREGCKCL